MATILRTTDDAMNYLDKENQPGILVGIDFTKAFDTISETLILDCLKLFGFKEDFRKWISTLLMQTESCINHYGWISDTFKVKRGIRQGCPLSPLLFVLAVEILAIKIRGANVKGIQIDTSPLITIVKILQFANDTTLFLKDKEDLDVAITVFNQFANISGLRMNKQKTEAM